MDLAANNPLPCCSAWPQCSPQSQPWALLAQGPQQPQPTAPVVLQSVPRRLSSQAQHTCLLHCFFTPLGGPTLNTLGAISICHNFMSWINQTYCLNIPSVEMDGAAGTSDLPFACVAGGPTSIGRGAVYLSQMCEKPTWCRDIPWVDPSCSLIRSASSCSLAFLHVRRTMVHCRERESQLSSATINAKSYKNRLGDKEMTTLLFCPSSTHELLHCR